LLQLAWLLKPIIKDAIKNGILQGKKIEEEDQFWLI
jgi:hypothetical protein